MVKVSKVSISGLSFTLEEDADKLMRTYLDKLSAHYKGNSNGTEIMEGIESRIAELLIDRGGKSGVVSPATVQEIIDIIGKPEDIYEDAADSSKDAEGPKAFGGKKRFYRDPDGKMVGGVCSGLGLYFKVDPVFFRLFFVVFAILGIASNNWFGWDVAPVVMILAYCIFWVVIPMARTTEQKCEMRGEKLSFYNIEKQVENRKEYESSRSGGSSFLSVCFKLVLAFFGFIIFTIGFAGIIGLVCAFFGLAVAGIAVPAVLTNILGAFAGVPVWAAVTIKVLSLLVVFLPFAGLLYGGILLLFHQKAPAWRPGLILFLVWIAAAIALFVIGATTIPDFWHMNHYINNVWI